MKNIGAQIEVFVEPRVREKEMVCLLLARPGIGPGTGTPKKIPLHSL